MLLLVSAVLLLASALLLLVSAVLLLVSAVLLLVSAASLLRLVNYVPLSLLSLFSLSDYLCCYLLIW